jgi:periplasmic protein TonB
MPERAYILDERDKMRRPLAGSLALHALVCAVVISAPLIGRMGRREPWGDPNAGVGGSVMVNVVRGQIPLPARSGPVNPLASDSQSMVPTPPPKAKPERKAPRPPEPDAIPLKSRNAPPSRTAADNAAMNRWRAQQKDLPNQMYSSAGQALVSPMVGQVGSGGVGFGTNTSFGSRFGYYNTLLRDAVARKWNTTDVDSRIRTAPPVIVSFTVLRNGQVKNVRVAQRSGLPLLDSSAERAIYDASPFPALPAEYQGSEATVEFWFNLSR